MHHIDQQIKVKFLTFSFFTKQVMSVDEGLHPYKTILYSMFMPNYH